MKFQLAWEERESGEQHQPIVESPVAVGSNVNRMPNKVGDKKVTKVVINDRSVSDYHALIEEVNGQLVIEDQNINTSISVNDVQLPTVSIYDGDRIYVGAVVIQVRISSSIAHPQKNSCENMVGFLFKRRCNRPKVPGSKYCEVCQIQSNPYAEEYNYYPEYGVYKNWGNNYYRDRHYYYYNYDTNNVEFTEADAVAFAEDIDRDFETDMGAS